VFEPLLHALGGVEWEADLDAGRISFVGAAVEPLFGFPRQRRYDEPALWEQALHPEDRVRALSEYHRALERGALYHSEYRIQTPDGRVRWVRDVGLTYHTPEGGRRIRGVKLDFTLEHLARVLERDRRAVLEGIVRREALPTLLDKLAAMLAAQQPGSHFSLTLWVEGKRLHARGGFADGYAIPESAAGALEAALSGMGASHHPVLWSGEATYGPDPALH